jgi:poly-gamma-glutamate synthesis protein (capsule biosynthesis protein)
MGVEFRENGFITYGLGNLFFNQANELEKKQGIIVKHIFYDGRHINTILITTMLENLSQPRISTAEERLELLESIFDGSIR